MAHAVRLFHTASPAALGRSSRSRPAYLAEAHLAARAPVRLQRPLRSGTAPATRAIGLNPRRSSPSSVNRSHPGLAVEGGDGVVDGIGMAMAMAMDMDKAAVPAADVVNCATGSQEPIVRGERTPAMRECDRWRRAARTAEGVQLQVHWHRRGKVRCISWWCMQLAYDRDSRCRNRKTNGIYSF